SPTTWNEVGQTRKLEIWEGVRVTRKLENVRGSPSNKEAGNLGGSRADKEAGQPGGSQEKRTLDNLGSWQMWFLAEDPVDIVSAIPWAPEKMLLKKMVCADVISHILPVLSMYIQGN
ncbi:hypothetical protein DNTS_029311, partial [Danionella cerebrum]